MKCRSKQSSNNYYVVTNSQSCTLGSIDCTEDVETIKSKSTTAQENTLGKIANTMQQQQKKSQPILTTLTEITKEFKKEIIRPK